MKLELNIDPSKLSEDMKAVMASLSLEEKKELAKGALMAWLAEPIDAERAAFEADLVEKLKTERSHQGENDQTIRGSYDFRNRKESFKSSREDMVKEIRSQVVAYHKEQIVKAVQEDAQLNQVMKDTLEDIKKNFSAYVHDAMMAWFVANLQGMSSGMAMSLAKTKDIDGMHQRINDMNQKLVNRGIY